MVCDRVTERMETTDALQGRLLCVAVLSLAGADALITTTDMNIRFLAPCRSDVVAVAGVIKFGRTLCPVTIDLWDTSGTAIAVAQVTYMRLRSEPNANASGLDRSHHRGRNLDARVSLVPVRDAPGYSIWAA